LTHRPFCPFVQSESTEHEPHRAAGSIVAHDDGTELAAARSCGHVEPAGRCFAGTRPIARGQLASEPSAPAPSLAASPDAASAFESPPFAFAVCPPHAHSSARSTTAARCVRMIRRLEIANAAPRIDGQGGTRPFADPSARLEDSIDRRQ
jgi:hypothetical protein